MGGILRFIDLFGGIGGFRLGVESVADWECVWYCDHNKYSTSVYNLRFGEDYEPTDIREVEEKEIPEHDCICAGFPCQSFSVAGKRKGFKDTRGTLFYQICRIAEFHRPRWLFLENVRGLLSHDGGQTFARILNALQNLGYGVEWQVCNSKRHGVPQNRERVFIVGHLGGLGGQQVFPLREPSGIPDNGHPEQQIASSLQSPGHACGNYRGMNMIKVGNVYPSGGENGEVYDASGISRALKSGETSNPEHGGIGSSNSPKILAWQNKRDGVVPKDECPSLRASSGTDIRKSPKVACHTLQPRSPNRPSLEYSSGGSGPLSRDDGNSYCLDSGNSMAIEILGDYNNRIKHDGIFPSIRQTNARNARGNASKIIQGAAIRRLTPLECERLQGFPDCWTAYGVMDGELVKTSDTQRYKMLGNAVTVNVIADIARVMDGVVN